MCVSEDGGPAKDTGATSKDLLNEGNKRRKKEKGTAHHIVEGYHCKGSAINDPMTVNKGFPGSTGDTAAHVYTSFRTLHLFRH